MGLAEELPVYKKSYEIKKVIIYNLEKFEELCEMGYKICQDEDNFINPLDAFEGDIDLYDAHYD